MFVVCIDVRIVFPIRSPAYTPDPDMSNDPAIFVWCLNYLIFESDRRSIKTLLAHAAIPASTAFHRHSDQ